MNYQQALDYMFSQLPMFHRIGAAAYKENLDNTIALSELTGFPYQQFDTIHIAGTNGKGSVSHMLASVCMEAGLKTGLFTSPHLVDFRERIKINGQMISPDYVAQFINKYSKDFETIKPSFFEMTFILGMCWFKEMNVDIAIVETGLGGRLDSTNVITPVLSVITNIGYDHTQFLGNTLAAIAGEKAGIIKTDVPVVIGESNPETDPVFLKKSNETNSELIFADKTIELYKSENTNDQLSLITSDGSNIVSPLAGDYQIKNVKTVLASAQLLSKFLKHKSRLLKSESLESIISKGIKNTIINTGLEGRWQILKKKPLTICDIGHNTHGLEWVVKQIESQNYKKLHIVLGVVNDKDVAGMLNLLPKGALYYFCKADIPRGLPSSELKEKALAAGLVGDDYGSVATAWIAADNNAMEDDMVFIGGSAFVVAEVLPYFRDI